MRNKALQSADFRSIALDRINLQDDEFRITTGEDLNGLLKSIQCDGLITPPLLIKKNSFFTIISGFRRISVCQKLAWNEITARVLKPDVGALDCLRLAIADNTFQRPLNLIETSRCLYKLSSYIPNNKRLTELAANLGLPSNPAAIGKIRSLCLLPLPIQRSIMTERISLATAKELESLDTDSALSFARLFDQLKIGLNKQREIITLVREIASRDGLSTQTVMDDRLIMDIMGDSNLDRGQKTHKLRYTLRQRRYPQITAAQKTFETHRKNLKLGENIQLIPPKDFEATTYGLNLTFENLTQLNTLQKKLSQLVHHPALKKILDR